MPETTIFQPREGKTGLRDTDCLVFGNGIEIETHVYAKTTTETVKQTSDGFEIHVLPQRIGSHVQGTDIVKIHFLPRTSLAERANEPELVPDNEKHQIGIDAVEGLLSLLHALKQNHVSISGHNQEDDYYLFADTNPGFAAFLRNRAGFRGTVGGTQAWIKASEFISDDNQNRLHHHLEFLRQLASRQKTT